MVSRNNQHKFTDVHTSHVTSVPEKHFMASFFHLQVELVQKDIGQELAAGKCRAVAVSMAQRKT